MILGLPHPAAAHGPAGLVGGAYTALPGLYRVPVAEPSEAPLAGALSLGYGRTEPQSGESGAHHRASVTAALGVMPLPRLQSSLRVDARYDGHPSDAQGANSGAMISPTLTARWFEPIAPRFALGVEAAVWFPGTESASQTFEAASPHGLVFGTLGWERFSFTALAGYRLDRSSKARPDLVQMRTGDRVALGLSDFDAALAALGVGYALGPSRWFAEATADILIGAGAPPFAESPLKLSAGSRYAITDSWALELIGSVCLSQRPDLSPGSPLVPLEPRLAALAGARFLLPFESQAAAVPQLRADVEPRSLAPALVSFELSVRLDPARPATPTATLTRDGKEYAATSRGDHQFEFSQVPPGAAQLRVTAAGYLEYANRVVVPAAGGPRLQVQLQPEPRAQIRGLVRSLAGKGLSAQIRVEPLGIEGSTDAEGFFELDVPPGSYTVSIQANGFQVQQRGVNLERDAVVVLNADLLRQP